MKTQLFWQVAVTVCDQNIYWKGHKKPPHDSAAIVVLSKKKDDHQVKKSSSQTSNKTLEARNPSRATLKNIAQNIRRNLVIEKKSTEINETYKILFLKYCKEEPLYYWKSCEILNV